MFWKRKQSKKELLESRDDFVEKKIAILGGANTHEVREMLDLFLLKEGIRADFYELDYKQYWKEGIIFNPDVVFICTGIRNIEGNTEEEYKRFEVLWKKINQNYKCPIIQNNFEWPDYRVFGNQEAVRPEGKINSINQLNELFYKYALKHKDFYINDICYLAARLGIDKWKAKSYWYLYKNAQSPEATMELAQSVAFIIKSIFGKNKKAIVTDLDNTLWGGIIGEDGIEGIKIGQESPEGQAYEDFQKYLKSLKKIGIILNINSKNDKRKALKGLKKEENILKEKDFVLIKANWKNKAENIKEICQELNLLPDSLVFIDDDKRERELVTEQIPEVVAPPLDRVENYIELIDRSGFFEKTIFTKEDERKTEQYRKEEERKKLKIKFKKYDDYLKSLKMKAEMGFFNKKYLARIEQLINKSNQFNLRAQKYTGSEIEKLMKDKKYFGIYCKLSDKFGENGLVSAMINRVDGTKLHIENWVMSCRVLGRDLEKAFVDELIKQAKMMGVKTVYGYYKASSKNKLVSQLYSQLGFKKKGKIWELIIKDYKEINKTIKVRFLK